MSDPHQVLRDLAALPVSLPQQLVVDLSDLADRVVQAEKMIATLFEGAINLRPFCLTPEFPFLYVHEGGVFDVTKEQATWIRDNYNTLGGTDE